MTVRTSWHHNDFPMFLKLCYRWSVVVGGIGFLFGFLVGAILRQFWAPFALLVPILFALASGFLCESLLGGNYRFEGLDTVRVWFRKGWAGKREIRDLSYERAVRLSDDNDGEERDLNSWYTPDGREIFGVELISSTTPERFRGLVVHLLKTISAEVQIQFVRVQRRFSDPVLERERPILLERGVRMPQYLLFFSLEPTCPSYLKTRFLQALAAEGVRMPKSAMATYAEWLFAPENTPSGEARPVMPLSHLFESDSVHGYARDRVHASVSLARLPKVVGEEFLDVLAPCQTLEGVIVATFQKSMETASSLVTDLYRGIQLTHKDGNLSDVRKQALLSEMAEAERKGSVRLRMFLNMIVYGKQEDVDNAIAQVQLESQRHPNEEKRARFVRDSAAIYESLLSALPGHSVSIPFRGFTVVSAEEASFYVPRSSPKPRVDDPNAFLFRTVENAIFSFPYYRPTSTLIVGLPGFGKSLLLALFQITHFRRGDRGEKVASFTFDLGDSFAYCEEGLADFVLKLEFDNRIHAYKPLSIHPLACFAPFENRLTHARKFVCSIMGFDPTDKSLPFASDGEVVTEALRDFYAESRTYRLSEFYVILKRHLERFFARVRNREQKEALWDEFLPRLREVCQGGEFGSVLDPENPVYTAADFAKCRHLYACKTNKDKDARSVICAFVDLAFSLASLMAERFAAGGEGESANFAYFIDEWFWLRDFLNQMNIRDLTAQNRKFGESVFVATQQLSDTVLRGAEDDETKWSLLRSFSYVFLYGAGDDEEHLVGRIAGQPSTRDERGQRVGLVGEIYAQVAANVRAKDLNKPRTLTFIDAGKLIHHLVVDVDKDTLWAVTTHSGGRSLRRAARHYESSLSLFQIASLFADFGPREIPECQVSPEREADILGALFGQKIVKGNRVNSLEMAGAKA